MSEIEGLRNNVLYLLEERVALLAKIAALELAVKNLTAHNSAIVPCPAFQACHVCQISSSSVCGTVPCTITRHV